MTARPPRVVSQAPPAAPPAPTRSRNPRGRPALMTREQVLERIRELARSGDGLFRIHRRHADLYARARRYYGSWENAVKRAGMDYEDLIATARRRSRWTLRQHGGTLRESSSRGRPPTPS